jgi:ABC-2 type transport system ATP-binding protein
VSVVIETHSLTKVYEAAFRGQDVHALEDLNLEIHSGEIFGYLGPNGSGKTTTIKLLLGLIFPTSGSMEILGNKDIGSPAIRKKIGYLPEGAYYPDFLRGEEVLRFYGQLYGLGGAELRKRVAEALETVGMTRARMRLVRGYSKGMRQRIGLAQALLNDPQILILDEPTTGLDPIARKEIRDILANLRDEGKTLLISSHELLEVELISDRVGILSEGVLQMSGKLDDLLTNREVIISVLNAPPQALEKLAAAGIQAEDRVEDRVALRIPDTVSVYQALEMCRAENLALQSIAPRRETLEELFVRVIKDAQPRVPIGAAEKKGS